MRIYKLRSDTVNYSVFIEEIPEGQNSIMQRSVQNRWKGFDDKYNPIVVSLGQSDTGKKNYQFDICSFLSPFFIFSEMALEALGDILRPRGEVLCITTESEKKKFYGYYPTNPLSGCFDRDNSIYKEYPNGLMIRKCVLKRSEIKDDYLFCIEEDISSVYVTEKFKQRVLDAGLIGFDFSNQVEVS
ncbi:TPA: hypothetical protein RQJ82_002170 [Vibrio vulnificus]|uniref:hypothetical protein n=1 Tax=Vibrio vulnificus TaxID=672 RepID=UPI0028CFA4A7|nr:hypothetical protein [Vibrio vulnificus]